MSSHATMSMAVGEYELAGGQACRVLWSHLYGAHIHVDPTLSVVDRLRAIRWAVDILEEHVLVAPGEDLEADLVSVEQLLLMPAQRRTTDAESLPGPLNKWGRGVPSLVCIACGSEFHPDSSPDLDRCWSCAELADAEAGVQ